MVDGLTIERNHRLPIESTSARSATYNASLYLLSLMYRTKNNNGVSFIAITKANDTTAIVLDDQI